MSRRQEVAKFASGFEAFHALANAQFWVAGSGVELFDVTTTPSMHLLSASASAQCQWQGRHRAGARLAWLALPSAVVRVRTHRRRP